MESRVKNIVQRHGTVASRRAPLLKLGLAGVVAMLAHPLTAVGKKNSSLKKLKQAKKRCQQDLATCETEVERCVEQRRRCLSLFLAGCEGDPACLEEGRRCCAPLAKCNIAPFLRCLA